MTRTEMELRKRIEANNFEAITVTMKCNGDKVRITPCGYAPVITSFEAIDFYLVDSPSINLCGDSKLERVAHTLDTYAELLEEDAKEIEQLKAHIRQYGENADWDWVSDWHKDLFGHRPHVGHKQIIAWANSTSSNSARFYC